MSLSVLLMVTRTKTSNFNSSFSQDNSYNIQKSLEKTNRYVVHFIFTKTKIESICGMLLHSIERSPQQTCGFFFITNVQIFQQRPSRAIEILGLSH
jgi:hypothetical protein